MKQNTITFSLYSFGTFSPCKQEQYKTENYYATMKGKRYFIMIIKALSCCFIETGKKVYRFHPILDNKSSSRLANAIFAAIQENGLI